MNRRDFLATAAAGAAAIAWPRRAQADENDLNPVWAQIEKQHDEAVQRLQHWIRQPSIAAENRGMNEGCELMMQMLRDAGFDVTGVHNHLLDENPRVMYMHYMGQGSAKQLATSLHDALAESKTPLDKPASATADSESPAWVKAVQDAVGRQGIFKGGVLSFGVPRSTAITMNGMTITPAQGVAESINFQEAETGKVATTGDFVLTADEVNPVISALEEHQIAVTALHNHMLKEEPRLFFMHFWGLGSADEIGGGIKAALAKVSTK